MYVYKIAGWFFCTNFPLNKLSHEAIAAAVVVVVALYSPYLIHVSNGPELLFFLLSATTRYIS